MKQSTTLGATLACAQAIKLSSKAKFFSIPDIPGIPGIPNIPDIPVVSDIPDAFNSGIDYIGTGFADFGDIVMPGIDIITDFGTDVGTIIYDDVLVPVTDPLIDPVNTGLDFVADGSAVIYDNMTEAVGLDHDDVADFVVNDVGSVVVDDVGGFVVDLGEAYVEIYDWMGGEGNWEAFGKVLLISTDALLSEDYDKAIETMGTPDLYTEEYWNELEEERERARIAAERARIEAEENAKKYQESIDFCHTRLVASEIAYDEK